MFKRITSFVLAMAMCLGLMPQPALAAEETAEICICTEACAEEVRNFVCPVCGADDALMEDCTLYAAPKTDVFEGNAEAAAGTVNAAVVASGECGAEGDNVTWIQYDDGTVTISGTGKMVDYEELGNCDSPWYMNTDVKSVIIGDEVTHIGDWAFYGCTELTSLTMGDGIKSIGWVSFSDCRKLEDIHFSENLTVIDSECFSNCESLKAMTFPDSLTSLGTSSFQNCSSLEAVSLPKNLSGLNWYTFADCESLTSVTIPSSIASIGSYCFAYCDSLTQITFTGDAPAIETSVFDSVVATAYYPSNNLSWTEEVRQNYGGTITWTEYLSDQLAAEEVFQGNRYQIWDSSMTWTQAKAFCEEKGGHLVTINSAEEQQFIESMLSNAGTKKQYWIGAKNNGENFGWITGEEFSYTNWDYGEPNRSEQNGIIEEYVHLLNEKNPSSKTPNSKRFKWNDMFEDNMFDGEEDFFSTRYVGLICEYESNDLAIERGFSPSRDGWNLINTYDTFGYPEGYRIGIDKYISYGVNSPWYLLQSAIAQFFKWSGSCFGLSLLAVANYNGQIDLNTYFDKEGSSLNEYGYEKTIEIATVSGLTGQGYSVVGNQQIIELIERAQVSQFDMSFFEEKFIWDNDYSDLLDYLNQEAPTPLVVGMSFGLSGHAVVTDTSVKPIKCDNGWYAIMLYDCNSPMLTNHLENENPVYSYEQSILFVNINDGKFQYEWNGKYAGGNTYHNFGSRNIFFYDISKLDPSFFYMGLTLDPFKLTGNTWFSTSNITVCDSENNEIFDIESDEYIVNSDNLTFYPIYESIDNNSTAVGHLISEENDFNLISEGYTDIVHITDSMIIAYSADDNASAKIENGNRVTISNNSSESNKITVVASTLNGSFEGYVSGTIDSETYLSIEIDEQEEIVSIITNSNPEEIESQKAVDGTIVETNFHTHIENTEEVSVQRIAGETRYETGINSANALKEIYGVEKFNTIILACGGFGGENDNGFADALTGSYLAYVTKAPILMHSSEPSVEDSIEANMAYIQENLASDGIVYILGGEISVPTEFEGALKEAGIQVERLYGADRFVTNLEILNKTMELEQAMEEESVNEKEILISSGWGYADSLSIGATGLPILLLKGNNAVLMDSQIEFLNTYKDDYKITIVGGSGAVSEEVEAAVEEIVGKDVGRIYGAAREETSVAVAKAYFNEPEFAVVAYSYKFYDGLCGGPVARAMNAPLLLTNTNKTPMATTSAYLEEMDITAGYVMGVVDLLNDNAVKTLFGLPSDTVIPSV